MKSISIQVVAEPNFVPEQSDANQHKFVWSYEISITNNSEEIIQLLHRYWRITDMHGRVEEINGVGVIGLQPLIKPGKRFTYTSFCQLLTPKGTMEGTYEIQNLDEKRFKIEIPKFILTAPEAYTLVDKSKLH
jgi:ApaG protein